MADDAVIVINDYRGVATQERTRTSGKKTTTLSISAEPIAVVLDEKTLAKPAADAYVKVLQEQIGALTFEASPATKAKRKAAAKAFAAGESWATKQYAGGRMGPMPPNQSSKLYNDSGRLAAGITSNWSPQQKAWIVRFPVNRFAPDFLARPGGQAVLQRLIDLVPALRMPLQPAVMDAIRKAQAAMASKGSAKLGMDAARFGVRALQTIQRILGG